MMGPVEEGAFITVSLGLLSLFPISHLTWGPGHTHTQKDFTKLQARVLGITTAES